MPVYDQDHRKYIGTVAMYDVVMFLTKHGNGGDAFDEGDQNLLETTTVRKLIGLYREAQTVRMCAFVCVPKIVCVPKGA